MNEHRESTKNGIKQKLVVESEAAESEPAGQTITGQQVNKGNKAVHGNGTQPGSRTLTYKSLVAWLVYTLLIVVGTFAVMGGPLTVSKVVSDNFVSSQNSMKNVKGSGNSVSEFLGIRDHWVYFESTEPIVLKNQENYKTLTGEDLKWKANFFKIYTPEATALLDLPNLSGIIYKSGIYPISDEKYLLVNQRTHEYFFSDRHVESDGF